MSTTVFARICRAFQLGPIGAVRKKEQHSKEGRGEESEGVNGEAGCGVQRAKGKAVRNGEQNAPMSCRKHTMKFEPH